MLDPALRQPVGSLCWLSLACRTALRSAQLIGTRGITITCPTSLRPRLRTAVLFSVHHRGPSPSWPCLSHGFPFKAGNGNDCQPSQRDPLTHPRQLSSSPLRSAQNSLAVAPPRGRGSGCRRVFLVHNGSPGTLFHVLGLETILSRRTSHPPPHIPSQVCRNDDPEQTPRLVPENRGIAFRPDSPGPQSLPEPKSRGGVEDWDAKVALEDTAPARDIPLADFLKPYRNRCWSKDAYPPSNDEVKAILLACLPNLALLTSTVLFFERIPLAALWAAGVATLPLRTLEVLGLSANRVVGLASILDMASPTVRALRITGAAEGVLRNLAPRLGELRDNYVGESKLCISDLPSLLARCQDLERCVYEADES